jgi:Cell Wall Hydrolase
MLHDYPDKLNSTVLETHDMVEKKKSSHILHLVLLSMLVGGAVIAAILPKLNITEILYGNDNASARVPIKLISDAQATELIEATTGEAAALAADGMEAEQLNEALPFSSLPVELAAPFVLQTKDMSNSSRALQCLTQAVYYEAGFEALAGKQAVAQVILNRMRHPAYPKSVCGVVYQGSKRPGCQFSFACDGSLLRAPNQKAWAIAHAVALQALSGTVALPVGTATHYHANYVSPYWAPKLTKITQIGAHIFYRWPGNWGRRFAFTGSYGGAEFIPSVSSLANISLHSNDAAALAEGVGDVGLVDVTADLPKDITDRRTEADTGGRLDTSKTWRLSIPMPNEARSAFKDLTAKQAAEFQPSSLKPAGTE